MKKHKILQASFILPLSYGLSLSLFGCYLQMLFNYYLLGQPLPFLVYLIMYVPIIWIVYGIIIGLWNLKIKHRQLLKSRENLYFWSVILIPAFIVLFGPFRVFWVLYHNMNGPDYQPYMIYCFFTDCILKTNILN